MYNGTMHAKQDLRVFFNVWINRSGSVIAAVIRFNYVATKNSNLLVRHDLHCCTAWM